MQLLDQNQSQENPYITIDRTNEMVHLGVWLSEDLTWNKHISELCKKAYPRVKILTRLKYVGTSEDDLIEQ